MEVTSHIPTQRKYNCGSHTRQERYQKGHLLVCTVHTIQLANLELTSIMNAVVEVKVILIPVMRSLFSLISSSVFFAILSERWCPTMNRHQLVAYKKHRIDEYRFANITLLPVGIVFVVTEVKGRVKPMNLVHVFHQIELILFYCIDLQLRKITLIMHIKCHSVVIKLHHLAI